MSLSNNKQKAAANAPASKSAALEPSKGSAAPATKESEVPSIIRSNASALKFWEAASEEERNAGLLLCEFQARESQSVIDGYYDLADRWNEIFPRNQKKAHERGLEAVQTGAKIAGMSPTTVYTALKTTKLYPRGAYEALAKKAQENGGNITWTHLRIIADRLKDNREARNKVEHALVHRKMTEAQLHAYIDEIAPETERKARAGSSKEQTAIQQFTSMVTAFKNLSKQREKYEATLHRLNEDCDGSVEQCTIVLEQTTALIASIEEIHEFIEKHIEFVTKLRDEVQSTVDGESNKKVKDSADKIRKQITSEKKAERQKASERDVATARRGDIDDVVIPDDEEDFEGTDATDEELSQIAGDDDEIHVDDEDGDIFNEAGDIQ